jgi:hypothetical protein
MFNYIISVKKDEEKKKKSEKMKRKGRTRLG